MARFIFVVPPFIGHINPTLSTGSQLLKQGHDVAWTGHDVLLEERIPEGGELLPVADKMNRAHYENLLEKSATIRGLMSLKFFYEEVLEPLTRSTFKSVRQNIDTYKPDIVISDQLMKIYY